MTRVNRVAPRRASVRGGRHPGSHLPVSRALLALLLSAATLTGCLEIDGQRIVLRYDAAQDLLSILVFYDGIHDSGSDEHGVGAEQLRTAVRDGDVMFLDWYAHVAHAEVVKRALEEGPGEDVKLAQAILEQVEITAVARLRDDRGKPSAVQLIEVRQASELIRRIDHYISANIIEQSSPPPEESARSWQRMREAALDGHEWLRIEGNALSLRVPVDAGEWALVQRNFLDSLFETFAHLDADPAGGARRAGAWAERLAASVASVPVSLIDDGDLVTLRAGVPRSTSTWRLFLRGTSRPREQRERRSLEDVLAEALPAELGELLAAHLLGDPAASGGDSPTPPAVTRAVAHIAEWGPPEEAVRAVLRVATAADDERAPQAEEWLHTFARRWQRLRGVPPLPLPEAGASRSRVDAEAWRAWLGQISREMWLRSGRRADRAREHGRSRTGKPVRNRNFDLLPKLSCRDFASAAECALTGSARAAREDRAAVTAQLWRSSVWEGGRESRPTPRGPDGVRAPGGPGPRRQGRHPGEGR